MVGGRWPGMTGGVAPEWPQPLSEVSMELGTGEAEYLEAGWRGCLASGGQQAVPCP